MATFATSSVIVHDLPSVLGDASNLVLSDALSTCPQDVRNRFDERINHSLARAGTNVEFLEHDGVVRLAVAKLLASPSDEKTIVRQSKKIATHLAEVQTGRNSPGILVISVGKRDANDSVAIMKLEREAGVQLQESTTNGKRSFDLAHLNDLMLTDKTRTLKVAEIFDVNGTPSGVACDDQMGNEFARFFLKDFLGCQLCLDPSIASERFLTSAQEFIDKFVASGEQKVEYHAAVVVELMSKRQQLDPRKFATDHIESQHRDLFLNHIRSAGVPSKRFPKDTSRILSKLRSKRLRFQSGIVALIPSDLDVHGYSIEDLDDGRTRVVIEDHLDSVRGGR